MVVDGATANKEHLTSGRRSAYRRGPAQLFRISGFVKFGSVATSAVRRSQASIWRPLSASSSKPGKLDEIAVASKPGVSDARADEQISSILPPEAQVRTGAGAGGEGRSGREAFIGFLQKFLLVFAGIALFVGSFVIANSLSITIAQRTREFATLRTLGASRRQVLGSIVVESLVDRACSRP